MRRRPASMIRQRGVAVVTALLLATLAITIVASLFWQQQVQVRSIENQRLQLQKEWILRGALDWARLILRESGRMTQWDDLTQPWAIPLEETRLDQYVENGRDTSEASDASLSGGIYDAQARFNLTNLAPNGTLNPEQVKIFENLLNNLQLPAALARKTATLMVSARKPPEAGTQGAGMQGAPQPLDIRYAEDLLAVPGMTPEIYAKLKDYVIVLPTVTPVNVNTAPAEVLAASIDTLTLSEAKTLVESRKQAAFRNVNELAGRLGGKTIGGSALNQNASVTTDYFLVNGNVRLSRASLRVLSLIHRDRGKNTTDVVWIRET